jgi:hypothetical protein
MRGHGPLSEPEWAQLEAELAPARGIAVGLCISLAFWAVVAAVVAALIN